MGSGSSSAALPTRSIASLLLIVGFLVRL
ncbi:hypothetical protein LINPERHAP2_LOCUS38640 [Linum perenne]